MGFGDPYHKHPLRDLPYNYVPLSANCFHCELPIEGSCYGCEDCNYYIHYLCHDLPTKLIHPLHDQHYLTLFEPPGSSFNSPNILCNQCQDPCLGRFAYQCTTCQFFFHLKCLFTLNLDKHKHPLIFDYPIYRVFDKQKNCKICGLSIHGFVFSCRSCRFYIHYECSLMPLEIKHHHIHKLTLRHNFPEECDQVYCDRCEDRDGEMDRTQSYYYCKDCDYIAHINCCITQPIEDVLLIESFTHEHPLRFSQTEGPLSCTQCSYTVSDRNLEVYPSLVKHPRHPYHTLLFDSKSSYHFNCTECNFSMVRNEFIPFTHPLWRERLEFSCKHSMFRCDACGGLGNGSRIKSVMDDKFDIHLECFALPGKLEHESHSNHPLYLRWLDESTSRCCSICRNEMDPQLWFYFCQQCDYGAHMDCIARDLLLTLRSSIKNQPDYCAIIEPDESLFKYRLADMRPPQDRLRHYHMLPPFLDTRLSDLGAVTDGYELPCPKCNSIIPTQVGYLNIACWKSHFRESSITTSNYQTPSELEPLGFLDEQMIDEICCSICNLSIFPPTYSCASCQIFFHKSCAELPQKILYNDTTYVLMAPSFPEGLSDCTICENPISSWAYISPVAGLIIDVKCAAGAPLFTRSYCEHTLSSYYNYGPKQLCIACKTKIKIGTYMMSCESSRVHLHPECGLLPAVIKHRIHHHPLELATNLAKLDCEYFCDVCEKDLNPDVWAYRCVDWCGFRAVSHVSCVTTSKKQCHFSYDLECRPWTEKQKQKFWRKAKGDEVSDSAKSASENECEEVSDSTNCCSESE